MIFCNGRFYEIVTLHNTILCILEPNYEFTDSTIKLERAILSKTLVTNYKSKRRHILHSSY
jgi:hypothetical protein